MSGTDLPPQPLPDVDTEGFWKATAEGRLALCRCTECRRWQHPPLERCGKCGGPTAFEDTSGRGRLYSYIVERRGSVTGYLAELPYVVGLIELDDQPGLRLPALLPDLGPEDVEIGAEMAVDFVPLAGGSYVLPVFRPAVDAVR